MMKVLAIVANLDLENLGGAEHHFVEVAKRLTPKADVFVPKINYPHIPNLSGLFYILFATPAMIYHALRYKPDLIWAKQEFPEAQVGAIVRIMMGIPLYITSQNPMLGEEELVGVGGKIVTILVSLSFRVADTVAAVSSYSAKLAKKLGAKKIVIIPNGIDLEKFKKQKLKGKITKQKLKIITTSSLIPRNGVDTLVRACGYLGINFELVIAGDGPEENNLKNLAKDMPIKFLGRVPNKLVPSLLATSHLFVRPSRFEGFGSSFIEAMAAGLPVIGTPVGGILDFLKDKQTGFLVPIDDPKALAKKIEYVYFHPKTAEKIAMTGQEFVKENYSWNRITNLVWNEFLQFKK